MKPENKIWRILQVDDDEDDYIIVRDMLKEAQGRSVTLDWAASLDEGRQKLYADHYHAVLVDYDLGIGTGIELMREFTARGYPAPMILLTGRGSYEVDVEAMHAGATLYLTKDDINPLLLERSIRYAIERKQTEQALLERDQKLSVALDAANLGTWTYCFDDHMFEMDERAQQLYRVSQPRISHDTVVQNYLHPNDVPVMWSALDRAADPAGDGRYHMEYRILQPDGSVNWLNAWGLVEFEGQGAERKAVRLTGATRDITWEKQAELKLEESNTALRESERSVTELAGRFQSILENSLDVAYRRNLQTDRYDYMSPVVEQVLGFTPDEMMNITTQEMLSRIHPEDLSVVEEKLARSAEKGKGKLEYRLKCKDGRYRWLADYITVTKDASGNQLYRTGIIRDVTDQVQAAQALKASEERFQLASRAVAGVLYDWTIDGIEVFQSEGLERVVGYQPGEEQADGKNWWPRNIHPDDYDRIQAELQTAIEGQRDSFAYEYRFQHKEGHWVNLLDQGYIVRDENGRARRVVGMCTDISERVDIEQALRESEERFHQAIENMLNAVGVYSAVRDPQGKIIDFRCEYVNQVACQLNRMTKEQQNGRLLSEILPSHRMQGLLVLYAQVVESGKPFIETELSYEDIYGNGQRLARTFEMSIAKMGDGIVAAWRDITERIKDEEALKGYAVQLEQANRELEYANQELKAFTSIASHDLQEPLRKVSKFGEVVLEQYGSSMDEAGQDYLRRMVAAAYRMQEMMNDLLDYSRVTTLSNPMTPVNLSQTVREVLKDLEVRVEQTGGVVEVEELPWIEADPMQMRQLMQNLIGNALKFHKPGVPPQVKVWAEACKKEGVEVDCVRLIVHDSGIGFDPQLNDQLFQPFMRLNGRSEYEGTGMGLAICRKIVERHGGTITASSQLGEGSRFVVTLPVRERG